MHLERQAGAGAAQPGVVGHRLPLAEAEELAQGQAVGAAPLQPALAVDPLEVADQQHTEVPPRWQRRPALPRRVVRRALALDEAVEPGAEQFGLEPVVERVAWRARHLRPGPQQFRLPIPLPSQRHAAPVARVLERTESSQADFVNGLLGVIGNVRRQAPSGSPANPSGSAVTSIAHKPVVTLVAYMLP